MLKTVLNLRWKMLNWCTLYNESLLWNWSRFDQMRIFALLIREKHASRLYRNMKFYLCHQKQNFNQKLLKTSVLSVLEVFYFGIFQKDKVLPFYFIFCYRKRSQHISYDVVIIISSFNKIKISLNDVNFYKYRKCSRANLWLRAWCILYRVCFNTRSNCLYSGN